jgi:hypothetical protein
MPMIKLADRGPEVSALAFGCRNLGHSRSGGAVDHEHANE